MSPSKGWGWPDIRSGWLDTLVGSGMPSAVRFAVTISVYVLSFALAPNLHNNHLHNKKLLPALVE